MKKYLGFLLTVMLFSKVSAVPPDGQSLASGTAIVIKVATQWSSTTKDCPAFIVANDVTDQNGNTIIPAGTKVTTVCKIKKERGCGIPAKAEFNFISTTTKTGQTVSLTGTTKERGQDKIGLSVGLTVGLSCVIGPFAWPCLAIKGKPIELSPTYQTSASTIGNVIIKQ
jgi:hypothetical protein